MNNKTKLSLTITAMVLIAMIAIVSIIAVFAARTQNFTSNIRVTYTSREVQGTATARWGVFYYSKIGDNYDWQNRWPNMKDDSGNTEIKFEHDKLENKTLNPEGEIVLEDGEDYVVFEYNFTNEGQHPYELTLTYQDDEIPDENVDLYTWVTPLKDAFEAEEGSVDFVFDYEQADDFIQEKFNNNIVTTIVPNENLNIYILLKISNTGKNASFSGTINFNLDGTNATDYNDDFLYYTNGESATIIGVANGEIGDYEDVRLLDQTELTIPLKYKEFLIKGIGNFALISQTKIETISSFGNVECLGYSAFEQSGLIGELTIPGTVKKIEEECFTYTDLTKVILQNGIEYIGSAFKDCFQLTSITIPTSVVKIGSFWECDALNEIIIDSQEVCNNLLNWNTSLETELQSGGQIKAKYEIAGLEEKGFTKGPEKEGEYWVYTKNA